MFPRILSVAIVCLSLVAFSVTATGQGKKDGKAKDAKAIGAIEVFKNDKGKYRYRIKDDENKTIAMPLPNMSWDSKADVLKAIDELRMILNKVQPVEIKQQSAKAD